MLRAYCILLAVHFKDRHFSFGRIRKYRESSNSNEKIYNFSLLTHFNEAVNTRCFPKVNILLRQ